MDICEVRVPTSHIPELMGADVLAVMDFLNVDEALLVGRSDGACTALILGRHHPARVCGVVFFACNMDPSGVKPFELTPTIERCLKRNRLDYARLSPTPENFDNFAEAVGQMQQTQPNYGIANPEQSTFLSLFCRQSMTSLSDVNMQNTCMPTFSARYLKCSPT